MGKTIIIGDIHGCFAEFAALLEKCVFSREEDTLILLGDIIDRGPDVYSMVTTAERLKYRMGNRFVCLRGNHEDMLLESYSGGDWDPWANNGAGKTKKSFYKNNDRVQRHLAFFRSLPLYYETEQFICVHAGISSKGLAETQESTFLWKRDVAEESEIYVGKLLIYGHTPVSHAVYRPSGERKPVRLMDGKTIPLPKTGSINIDTGCIHGDGALTALVIERDMMTVHQVKSIGKKGWHNESYKRE